MNKRTLNTRLADFWYWLARNTSTGSLSRRATNWMYSHYFGKLNRPYYKLAGYWTELVN